MRWRRLRRHNNGNGKLGHPLPSLEHVLTLTDDVGIIQHASEDVPNRPTGYCTDDVTRAFIVALQALQLDSTNIEAERIAATYLAFLFHAQRDDGLFHNFMAYDRTWLDDVGSYDSNGRAMWAAGYGMRFAPRDTWRRQCERILRKSLSNIYTLVNARPFAYAAFGLTHALVAEPECSALRGALRGIVEHLKALYENNEHTPDWDWFEDFMTYDNARLPEALLRAGHLLRDRDAVDIGVRTLAFYTRTCVENGVHVPIGNDGWYYRGKPRATYAQQPLESLALVDAADAAYEATGDPSYLDLMHVGLDWYYGRNSRSVAMVNGTGGCYDGLQEAAVNYNMGAESTLAFLAAAYAVALSASTRSARSAVLRHAALHAAAQDDTTTA